MMAILSLFVLLPFLLVQLNCIRGDNPVCEESESCSDCMRCSHLTAWCFSSKFDHVQSRCGTVETLLARGCPMEGIRVVKSSFNATRKDPPSDDPTRRVEIYPQRMNVSMRVGDEVVIPFNYRKSGNYPVDLYILSDLSKTMKKYIRKIATSAEAIAKNMTEKTSLFRMGFGSFVDKKLMPFHQPKNILLCEGGSEKVDACIDTIGYHHNLNLTSDYSLFSQILADVLPSVNLDQPEGGFDAILQAVVCDNLVGWDPMAEKLILYITNGGVHMAGDGLLAGLAKPAEEECHMGRRKPDGPLEYLKSTELDYPSLEQIKRWLDKKGIGIMFAVQKEGEIDNYAMFSNLAKALTKAYVRRLPIDDQGNNANADVSGIVNLIRETYDSIASAVVLRSQDSFEDSDSVEFEIETLCEKGGQWQSHTKCDNIKLGANIQYRLRLKVTECLKKPVVLSFTTGSGQKLELIVSTLCECADCVAKHRERKSKTCNQHGELVCGRCECEKGGSRWGRYCECRGTSNGASKYKCKKNNDMLKCSGHGTCSCEGCVCQNRYKGEFCDCDLFKCPKAMDDDTVCGGKTRGTCQCSGICDCKEGYTGEACDCLKNGTKYCANPTNKIACSGHGTCDCGACVCDSQWDGRYCDRDSRLTQGRPPACSIPGLDQCCICHYENTLVNQINADEICQEKCGKIKDFVVKVEVKDDIEETDICSFEHKDCDIPVYTFWAERVEIKQILNVVVGRNCKEVAYASASPLVLGVIGGILLSGFIALAIWRIVAYLEDKQEYERLMNDKDQFSNMVNENPLYESPNTTVINPLHDPSHYDEVKYRL